MIEPLSPQRKWRAITLATLVLVPAFWAMLAGLVTDAADDDGGVGNPLAAVAFGLALVPFVFIVLAFLSQHRNPARAVVRAMGMCLVVGIIVSAGAADAVTGIVAGVGAGGIIALRADAAHSWQSRAVGVVVAAVYTLVLARTAGSIVLLSAPVFPLTAIGIADHVAERRWEREVAASSRS